MSNSVEMDDENLKNSAMTGIWLIQMDVLRPVLLSRCIHVLEGVQ